MIVFMTGGSGALGRAARPALEASGHRVVAPARTELDLFDPEAVRHAVDGAGAVLHLATRIPAPARFEERDAWRENDRLRATASRILVDAALEAGAQVYVQPSVAFVYPEGAPADEDTPVGAVPAFLRSALLAEAEAQRFTREGRRGVVLRLGLLDGPGTGNPEPRPEVGSTLHVDEAGRALAAALELPAGIYNVGRPGERISSERFRRAAGWLP